MEGICASSSVVAANLATSMACLIQSTGVDCGPAGGVEDEHLEKRRTDMSFLRGVIVVGQAHSGP